MQRRSRRLVQVLVVVAVLLVGVGYRIVAHTQIAVEPLPAPVVIAGTDIGFRMTGRKGDRVVGEWVVRVGGEWGRTAPPSGVIRTER